VLFRSSGAVDVDDSSGSALLFALGKRGERSSEQVDKVVNHVGSIANQLRRSLVGEVDLITVERNASGKLTFTVFVSDNVGATAVDVTIGKRMITASMRATHRNENELETQRKNLLLVDASNRRIRVAKVDADHGSC